MEELNYKKLRDLLYEEKNSGAVVALPDDFYGRLREFMLRKKSELEASRSLVDIREFENLLKTVREIYSLREQKIIFRALRSEGKHDTLGLTREEHELFDRASGVVHESRERLDSLLELKALPPEKRESGPGIPETFKKVKIIKEVPAYKGTDSATYGPFKPGDESALPNAEAEWLIKSRFAEEK